MKITNLFQRLKPVSITVNFLVVGYVIGGKLRGSIMEVAWAPLQLEITQFAVRRCKGLHFHGQTLCVCMCQGLASQAHHPCRLMYYMKWDCPLTAIDIVYVSIL